MSTPQDIASLQQRIWDGSLPLEIRLAPSESRTYDQADPYLIQYPRLSYLPVLLPRLHAFLTSSLINTEVEPHDGWFSFQGVPLKWHYPLGLLYDLFSGAEPFGVEENGGKRKRREASEEGHDDSEEGTDNLPWKLTVHFTNFPEEQLIRLDAEGKVLHDAFINSVKEADFLRNGTAKVVMSLSKDDSTQLWQAVQAHDLRSFNAVNQKLLNPPGTTLRHIPVKVYLPATPSDTDPESSPAGSLRVVQSLITPMLSAREPQTLGTALHALLPTVFPSRRRPILAQAVLHGAALPLHARMEELLRSAAYADGFLHIAVAMMG